MLVYFECFNRVQIAHACLRRLFQCERVYLLFTYNDIYICYKSIHEGKAYKHTKIMFLQTRCTYSVKTACTLFLNEYTIATSISTSIPTRFKVPKTI